VSRTRRRKDVVVWKVALAVLAIALALPGQSLADNPPAAPAGGMPPSGLSAGGLPLTSNGQPTTAPAENEELGDIFLLALLALLILIIPVIVLRQRNARERETGRRPAIRLVWSRTERNRGDEAIARSRSPRARARKHSA
jgi:hypothetical protein